MQDTSTGPAPVSLADEMKLVPTWAIALAILVFACAQVLFHVWIPTQHNPPPPVARVLLGIIAGAVLAAWMMLVGYVNQDARRRNMSRLWWTLLVIFIPNALGFVLYFLLRQPAQQPCPQCGTMVLPGFNYCPKCNCKLHPHCAQCQRPVRLADIYCPYCGYKLDQIVHSGSGPVA